MSPTPKDKQRPKAGGSATTKAAPPGRLSNARRKGLIAFGVILVGLFAYFAIGPGLGDPAVPDGDVAIVSDTPSGTQSISQKDLDTAMQQTAARAGVQEIPAKNTKLYGRIQQAAFASQIDSIWISSEAQDLGLQVTESDVDDEFNSVKKQFPSEAQFTAYLKQNGYTVESARETVKVGLLGDAIEKYLKEQTPPVTEDQISDRYEDSKATYTTPASRDVRLVLNQDKAKVKQAKAELEKGSTDADWTRIAAQYSTDTSSKSNGGLRPGLTDGLIEEPLNSQIFKAPRDEIEGPVKTPVGWYVFEVVKITDEEVQPLDKVRSTIRQTIATENASAYRESFTTDYRDKWKSRTVCASAYTGLQFCKNYVVPAHADTVQQVPVDPACYEADPKKPPKACPAPVAQLVPAMPGTVSSTAPTGVALPQRPQPFGLKPAPATPAALPGTPVIPGATTGSTPGG